MFKIYAVALTEYRQVVFTKSFIFSLLFPLIIYGGMFLISAFLGDKTDLADRKMVVVDRTDKLYGKLSEASVDYNRSKIVFKEGKQISPKFILMAYEGEIPDTDKALMIELSDKVRDGEIFAFSIIGKDYLSLDSSDEDYLHYFSDSPTFTKLPDWLFSKTKSLVESHRFEEFGYDEKEINKLTSHNQIERYKLAEVDENGDIIEPEEENRLAAFFIPFGIIMLIFISIQMTTPVLLNSVIEEKMQRIAEVLTSSVTPFQLLSGKLIGGVSVGLTFSAVYLLSLSLSLRYFEKMSWVPAGTYGWFFVFLIMGMLCFGSLFAGVSSACQDLKDSQNFAGPIIMFLVLPMILSLVIIESPDGPLALAISFIPPFSVMGMMTRVAISPGPPEWQIWTSLLIMAIFTTFVIWAGSRIFRIGILSQGKTPSWKELIKWIFRRG